MKYRHQGKLRKLAPQVDLSKNKVLRKAKKKRLRVPLVSEMISSLPPMVNVVRLPVKPKNGNWEAQVGLIKMTLKADEFNSCSCPKRKPNNLRRNRLT